MNYYLNRFSVRGQLIVDTVDLDLGIIIVIPCCNEHNLVSSLQSVINCELPKSRVEVITVINASETANEEVLQQNQQILIEAEKWYKNHQTTIKFYFLEENQLPTKDAGVGLARKIGMDEAVRRFDAINKPSGIILCFDADAACPLN